MTGLVVEGENPEDWGFDADARISIERTRLAFATRRLSILDDQLSMWNDIRRGAETSPRCPPDLGQWLAGLDLAPHYARSRRREWLFAQARKLIPAPLKEAMRPIIRRSRLRAHRKAVL
jgi:hypothetical protein